MTVHVSLFPEKLAMEHYHSTQLPTRWPVLLRDEDGNRIHLTDAMADELAAMLIARHGAQPKQRKAA